MNFRDSVVAWLQRAMLQFILRTSVFCRKRLAKDTPSFVVLLLGAAVADTAAAGAAAAAGGAAAGVDPSHLEAAASAPPSADEPRPSFSGSRLIYCCKALLLAGADSPQPSDAAAGAAECVAPTIPAHIKAY